MQTGAKPNMMNVTLCRGKMSAVPPSCGLGRLPSDFSNPARLQMIGGEQNRMKPENDEVNEGQDIPLSLLDGQSAAFFGDRPYSTFRTLEKVGTAVAPTLIHANGIEGRRLCSKKAIDCYDGWWTPTTS